MILSNEHRQEITSQNQNVSGNLRLLQIYLTYHSNNLISMSLGSCIIIYQIAGILFKYET